MSKLSIGILGAGHLGKIHIRCLQGLGDIYDITGFYDPDDQVRREVESSFGVRPVESAESLIDGVDVVDVVTPTQSHYALIAQSLSAGKHVFTEKPVTHNVEQARSLLELAREREVLVQVGHVERYNPAFVAAEAMHPQPMFIEGHRLAQFNPRGTDVSVVHDLMIHDLDILVALIRHPVAEVHASGVSVISDQPDICNARIAFENGAVANLTASRISLKNMRKLRLFQRDAYISMDFLDRKTEVIQLLHTKPDDDTTAFEIELQGKSRWIQLQQPQTVETNAIQEELKSFHNAIQSGGTPDVTLEDALAAMELAEQILNAIEKSASKASI